MLYNNVSKKRKDGYIFSLVLATQVKEKKEEGYNDK